MASNSEILVERNRGILPNCVNLQTGRGNKNDSQQLVFNTPVPKRAKRSLEKYAATDGNQGGKRSQTKAGSRKIPMAGIHFSFQADK